MAGLRLCDARLVSWPRLPSTFAIGEAGETPDMVWPRWREGFCNRSLARLRYCGKGVEGFGKVG